MPGKAVDILRPGVRQRNHLAFQRGQMRQYVAKKQTGSIHARQQHQLHFRLPCVFRHFPGQSLE